MSKPNGSARAFEPRNRLLPDRDVRPVAAGGSRTPAVAYVRMSSDLQEASPEQQRNEIVKLAERHGCRIIRWYSDEGISGDATEKRKDFQRMIRDAEEKGDFAAIVCWDQDRFGRFDSIEAGRWIYPLRQAGVWLLTVGQGLIDWNDFSSRMVYSVLQEGKHQFLIDLSKNVLRGKLQSAREGRGSTVPPAGYDRAFFDRDGKLVKRVAHGERFSKPRDWSMRFVLSDNRELLDAIRWIFRTFAETDWGLSAIAGELNHRGVKTAKGKAWSIQTVEKVLKNRTYTGANVFGQAKQGKYHHAADGEIVRGPGRNKPGDPIIIEGIHEPLIDRDTFDQANEKLAQRGETGRKPRASDYLLSGVLRCGHCGGSLAGKGYTKKPKIPRYYACVTGATRPGACCRYQIPKKPIEEYVLNLLADRLQTGTTMDRIKKAIYERARQRPGWQTMTRQLRAKVEVLDKKIAKGTENLLLADPGDIPDLARLLGEWKTERSKLQRQLETAASNPTGKSAEETARRAVEELKRLREHLKTGDPMRVRAVVHAMVEEVRLWWKPYGPRCKRLADGVIRFRPKLELLSTGMKTASATSSARDTDTG